MNNFLQELLHKAMETVVVVVTTAITKGIVATCWDKCKKKTTLTPDKRNKGGKSKKKRNFR